MINKDVRTEIIHVPKTIDRDLLLHLFKIAGVPVTKTEQKIIEKMPLSTDDKETSWAKLRSLKEDIANSIVLNADHRVMLPKAEKTASKELTAMWNDLEDDE